jgi:hypothetical protein
MIVHAKIISEESLKNCGFPNKKFMLNTLIATVFKVSAHALCEILDIWIR